jgi:DNA-binding NarL/FixJ family response regulator
MSVRVLLADDQRLVRESLSTMLGLLDGIELLGAAADGEEAVRLASELRPAVVLMDLRMPGIDGIEATRLLREQLPEIGVIALTTYADDESVLGALRAGARGYLTKDASSEDIRAAILCVASGSATLDPAVQHHVVAALASGPAQTEPAADTLPDELTPREAEVLVLIAEGLSNDEIAARLFVSQTTVKSHINHLFAKAGLRDRAQAVNYAYRTGLAQPPG